MKIQHIYFCIASIAGFLILSSCNNDVELFGDITELPIVYGLLSSSDSAQYIRVERSFADPSTSAVLLAQDENAVYFDDVVVDLINEDNDVRTTMARVDAAQDGYVRKEGDFLTSPNFVYKVLSNDIDLSAGTNYKLEVIKSDVVLASSSTKILAESQFFSPAVASGIAKIGFSNGKNTMLRWKRVPNASNYAISFDFTINERNIVSGSQEIKKFRWNATGLIADDQSASQSQSLSLDGQSFFQAIQSNLDPIQDVTRQLIQLDVRVTSFGDALEEYLEVINANSGITSAQEVPTFTNIEGGLGLFSATNETLLLDLAPSPNTLDSLYDGGTTANLRFTP